MYFTHKFAPVLQEIFNWNLWTADIICPLDLLYFVLSKNNFESARVFSLLLYCMWQEIKFYYVRSESQLLRKSHHRQSAISKQQLCNIVLIPCRRADGQLLSLWDGCEIYFLRSVARLALLNVCLQNPSRDLGPPAVERCRGFAVHLMVSGAVFCAYINCLCVKYLQSWLNNATILHLHCEFNFLWLTQHPWFSYYSLNLL
jgi:hypothetical protein